jgi:hypothetical protein
MLFDSASSGYAVATIGGDLPAISSSYAGYTLQVANSAPYSASWVAVPNVTVTTAVSSSFAATASSADNLTVRGTLTAQTINVQTITSSIEFVTGSTRNGSIAANTHQFTGSVLMSGSLGIGTSSPLAPLYILAPTTIVDSNGQLFVGASDALGTDKGGQIMLGGKYTSTVNTAFGGIAAKKDNATDGNFGGYFQFFSSTHGVGNTEKMRITSAGNVLIGKTTSTGGILQVSNGTNMFNVDYDANGPYITAVNNANTVYKRLTYDASEHIFATSATERMRITSVGKIEMGTTAVAGEIVKVIGTSGSDNYISVYSGTIQMFLDADASNSSGIVGTQSNHNMKLRSNGTNRMNIDTSGNIGAPNSGTNIYNASDIRLKKNITTITNGLDKISALNPVKFNWIDGFVESEEGKDMLGFVAQEVQNIVPEAVESFGGNSITIGDTIIDNPLRVNEKFLIPVLVKAIQELSAENDTLKEILQRNNIQ